MTRITDPNFGNHVHTGIASGIIQPYTTKPPVPITGRPDQSPSDKIAEAICKAIKSPPADKDHNGLSTSKIIHNNLLKALEEHNVKSPKLNKYLNFHTESVYHKAKLRIPELGIFTKNGKVYVSHRPMNKVVLATRVLTVTVSPTEVRYVGITPDTVITKDMVKKGLVPILEVIQEVLGDKFNEPKGKKNG